MAVQLAKRLISVDEYHTMAEAGILTTDDRVELIHGEILEMNPIGKKHRSTVIKIENNLKELFGNKALISVQNPININDLNEPEPDVAILKTRKDFYDNHAILPDDIYLIIEVSDTTYQVDKEVKLPLYAVGSIPEYWIVNLAAEQIEVYTHPSNGRYKKMEIFDKSDSIPMGFCKSEIRVDQLVS